MRSESLTLSLNKNQVFTPMQVVLVSWLATPWAGFYCLFYSLYAGDRDPEFTRFKYLAYVALAYLVWNFFDGEMEEVLRYVIAEEYLWYLSFPLTALFASNESIAQVLHSIELYLSPLWVLLGFFLLSWIVQFKELKNWKEEEIQSASWITVLISIPIGWFIYGLVWILVETS